MAAMRSWRLNGADAEVAAAVSAVVVTELARIETIERPAPPTPSLTGVGAPGLASVALCEGAHRSTERSDGAERPRHSAPLRTIMRVVIRAIAIERGARGGSRPFNTGPRAETRARLPSSQDVLFLAEAIDVASRPATSLDAFSARDGTARHF